MRCRALFRWKMGDDSNPIHRGGMKSYKLLRFVLITTIH